MPWCLPGLASFVLLIFAAALPADAADAIVAAVPTSSDSQIWFGNALQVVLMACAAPIAAILCKLLWMAAAKIGIEASAADQAKLEAEAKAALTVGAVKAGDMIADRGWDHVDVHNAVLADALRYFLERFPDRSTAIAAQAGVDAPSTPSLAKDAAVTETLMARLPDAMSEASVSPSTPPVTTITTVKPGPPVEVVTETQGTQPQPKTEGTP